MFSFKFSHRLISSAILVTVSSVAASYAATLSGHVADENKAAVQGNIAYFGTYSVNEADGTLTLHVTRSSYPNWTGTDQLRQVTSLTAQELKYTNPSASFGGTAELVWKRVK